MPRTLVLMLALAALAAGCVNAPAPEEVEAASLGDSADAALALPVTEEFAGDIQLSAATPARTVNYGGTFSTVVEIKDNVTGFVLELEWEAATPASESLSMWVRPSGIGSLNVPPDPALVTNPPPTAQVDGTSPLRLALAADAFPEPGEYEIVVRASAEPAGAAANQPFVIHITTFAGVAFDEAYSALGEHGH